MSAATEATYSWAELLYRTLVKHEAIPDGYMAEFVALANSCQRAAERQAAKGAKLTNEEAALILHNRQSELEREQKTLTMSENMFLQSIGDRPRAYRSKLQKAWYEGPNARRDAEESERTRWLSSLADIVAKSPTPMGRLLCSQPGNLELLGGGRRASTLRSRVRELRKFFAWFSVTYEEEFPTTEEHFTGFLRARASEPCNRGALKATHRSFGFLEEVTGMPLTERKTKSKLYDVILRELLSTALPGKPAQQAPRFPIKVLTAVESFVVDETKPAYMRMYAWWVLLQNWCTLRFSDHRGISPRTIQEGAGFWSMLLERSKTIGRDKNVQMRPLYLDAACFFQYPGWFGSGWKLLSQLAPQDRDFLLPGPTPGLQGCTKVELRYDMGFAIQGRLLAQLSDSSQQHLIPHPAVHFWTPHSSRTFMPSATSALGFPKSDRDYLGGWAAENSDRYARVSRLKIQTMQKAVVQSISNPSSEDPLGEAETLTHLEQHFSHSLQHVPEHVRSKCLISLGGTGTATELQTRPTAQVVEVPALSSSLSVPPPGLPASAEVEPQTDRRKKTDSARTQTLGNNPRERREALRAACEPGYYICLSGKRSIRTLHCLGKCFMVPGVDYQRFSFSGRLAPAASDYDTVCKLCAKSDSKKSKDSSESQTSSSTEEN